MAEVKASLPAAKTSSSPSKDKKRGVRLLSLDGGGIRGFSELCILEKLMLCLQHETFQHSAELPKPCDVFDMICGTSTGGLIAIMLGRLRMSIDECINAYAKFAEEVFGDPNSSWKLQDGKYKASKLEKVVKEIVQIQNQGDRMLDTRPGSCKVFVCATPAATVNRARRLRTYDASTIGQCAIWEAARATSAAPHFFEAAEISFRPGVTERFVDGALGYNNPVLELYSEAKDQFPLQDVDCLISIGTGSSRYGSLPRPKLWETKIPINIIDALKTIALSCERGHEQTLELFRDNSDVYYRFSVDASPEKIGLDEWKRLGEVQTRTIDYMENPGIRRLTTAAAKSLHRSLHNSTETSIVPALDDLSSQEMGLSKPHSLDVNHLFPQEDQSLKFSREHSGPFHTEIIKGQRMDMFLHKLDVDMTSLYGVRKRKASRYKGTCEWIRRRQEYNDWRGEPGPRILIITAPPGQGKSTLAKYLLEEIRSETAISADRVVLEYFCHDSHGRNTVTVILQNLLYQVLANRPHLHDIMYHQKSELDERDTELTPDALWEILVAVLRNPRIQSVDFLVDGLDECEDASQSLLWKFIETEFVHRTLSDEDARRKFRILLTSRPTALARKIGLLSHELEIRRADVDPDIARYIEHRVDRMASALLIPSDVSEVVTELLGTGAGGMFLWVSLSLDQFEDFEESLSFYDILEILKNVPRDIKGLYKRALERIHHNDNFRQRSRKIFETLLVAGDSLNVETFALTMARWPETCISHSELQQRSDIRFEYTSKRVCGSIIRIVDNTIQFCHPSARQFLLSDAIDLELFSFDETMCHAHLAQICLKYLLLEDLPLETIDIKENLRSFPLLRYALTHWPLHMRSSKGAIWTYSTIVRQFFDRSNLSWLSPCLELSEHFSREDYADNDEATLIHFLAFHDLSNVLQATRFLSDISEDAMQSINYIWEANVTVDVRSQTNVTALMIAASFTSASLNTVKILLNQGADANAVDDDRATALHRAATGTDVRILRALIEKTADIDCKTIGGNTPLLCATHIAIVEALLEAGAEIDAQRNDGRTPLNLAAQEGNHLLFETLLKRGAAPETNSKDGWNPLYASANIGNVEILTLVLSRNPVIRAETENGWNPLHAAASNGSPEAVSMLLEHGISPNSVTKYLRTPLFMAALKGHVKVIDILLKAGAMVDHLDVDGEMPIHFAASKGQASSAIRLIAAGSPINVASKLNDTPLMVACLGGHIEVVRCLLREEADLNRRNEKGQTALWLAAESDHDQVCDLLIQQGAKTTFASTDGLTVLHHAAYHGRQSLIHHCLTEGNSPFHLSRTNHTPLSEAIGGNNINVVKTFLALSDDLFDCERINNRKREAMHENIVGSETLMKNVEMIKLLLDAGLDPNATDSLGQTTVFQAVSTGSKDAFNLFLELGVDPAKGNKLGITPLHQAATGGYDDILAILINEKVPISPQSDSGETPLHAAAFRRRYGCIDQLIEAGGNALLKNESGLSAMDIAAESPPSYRRMARWREHYAPKCPKSRVADATSAISVLSQRLATTSHEDPFDMRHVLSLLGNNLFLAEEFDLYRTIVLLGLVADHHSGFATSFFCDMCDTHININDELLRRCKTCAWDICKTCMSRYNDERTPDDRLCSGHEFLSIDIGDWDEIEPAYEHEPKKQIIVRERWLAEMQRKFNVAKLSAQDSSEICDQEKLETTVSAE